MQRGQAACPNPLTAPRYGRSHRCLGVGGYVSLGFETFFVKGDVIDTLHSFYAYECAFFIVSKFRIDSIA